MAMTELRTDSTAAGVLFITATAATMAGQILLEPILTSPDVPARIAERGAVFTAGAALEIVNALASAGIAIAFFTILGRCAQGLAVAYLGLRLLEASLGLFAATALLTLLSATDALLAIALHKWGFLLVLLVFSIGTLIFYPLLFRARLVPPVLSLWGLIGGGMLLLSCLLILFDRIETGSGADLLLSLPIWINEMVLALWLILRGVDLPDAPHPSTERP